MKDPENPYAGQGAVLLDIGDDVGALIVRMPASSEGQEVELRPVRSQQMGPPRAESPSRHYPHVGVVGRPTASGMVYSLVYPTVVEGTYELVLLPRGETLMTVSVHGSKVTEVDWPP